MLLQKIRLNIAILIALTTCGALPIGEATTPRPTQPVQQVAQPTKMAPAIPQPPTVSVQRASSEARSKQSVPANRQDQDTSCTLGEPKNLEIAKRRVKKYYEHDYIKNVTCLANQIKQYIESHPLLPNNPAIIFDIDDTVISSFDYAISTNFGYTTASHRAWALQAKRPIPPMLDLYNFILHRGIKVFFITGRDETQRKATEESLRDAGYTQWEKLYLRPKNDDAKSVAPYKINARREIESAGYHIIANVGDQESDLIGGFADKTFKLPNPMYTLD